jgi:glucose/arabinose dehydrogenase
MKLPLFLLLLLSLGLPAGASAQVLDDPSLDVEVVTSGLSLPTTMAFVGANDILVLEKDTGRVRRVVGGVLQPAPVLSLPVDTENERGALGIAVDTASPPHVFLFFTEATELGGEPIANRVYRYDWNPVSGTLTHRSLVLDLPVLPGPNHNGGVMVLGPPGEAPGIGDGSLLYAVIGDLNRAGVLQNISWGPLSDDSGVILRVRLDGTPAPGNPFAPYCSVSTSTTCDDDGDCPGGQTCQTKVARYYAYGVRNSFGLALDPVTGSLWDTENGAGMYDEVNRVAPGLNSGWYPIMGPDVYNSNGVADLFHMPGAGVTYSDPEFSWFTPIAPTAIVFPRGSSLGPAYDDVAIVADFNLQQLYALPLNGARTGFDVAGIPGLADLVADDAGERDALRLGTGFMATDLEVGPDGHLYVLTLFPGAIYRVVPEPGSSAALAAGLALLAVLDRRRSKPGLRAR